jgi:hypothetical protein
MGGYRWCFPLQSLALRPASCARFAHSPGEWEIGKDVTHLYIEPGSDADVLIVNNVLLNKSMFIRHQRVEKSLV